MIDIGAYGAVSNPSFMDNLRAAGGGAGTIQPGLEKDTFAQVASAAGAAASAQASAAFEAASRLRNRTSKLAPAAIRVARQQWTNVANDIEEMGGTAATAGAGYEEPVYEDYYADEFSSSKTYLYAGLAVASAAAIYLLMRR